MTAEAAGGEDGARCRLKTGHQRRKRRVARQFIGRTLLPWTGQSAG